MSKDFALHDQLSMYVRLDLLNVFNNTNYADYNVNYGNILGTPRTLKLQGGVRF